MKTKFYLVAFATFFFITQNVNGQVPIKDKVKTELSLPDLQIIDVKVSDQLTDDYNQTLYRIITYTVTNAGKKDICTADVGVQGYLTNTDPWDGNILAAGTGCGNTVGTRIGGVTCPMLNPGQSVTSSFRCYDKGSFANYKYYVLWVDHMNLITELNDDNNQKIVLVAPRRTPGIGAN